MKTRRVGGGYGSKLSRSCFPAVIAAVCSNVVNKPVKIVMPIETMTTGLGRRYSIYATYEVLTSCLSLARGSNHLFDNFLTFTVIMWAMVSE